MFPHNPPASIACLDHETLDLDLDGADLVGELTGIVGGDGHGDDGTADTAGTAKSHLGGNVDVGDVLVLAQKGEVENDGERSGAKVYVSMEILSRSDSARDLLCSENDELGGTTVQGLGGPRRKKKILATIFLWRVTWPIRHGSSSIQHKGWTYSLAPFLT